MTSDATQGVSRRTLLRGAAVGGALVWTTPAVQTLARPAFAAGSAAPGFGMSTVSVLFTGPDGLAHRMKWEFEDSGVVSEEEHGGRFEVGYCSQTSADSSTFFYRAGGGGITVSENRPPDSVLLSAAGDQSGFQLLLAEGATLVDWVVHQGSCCLAKGSEVTPTTQSGPLGSGYVVAVAPGPVAGSTLYTWPLAPNTPPCTVTGP